jgi:hypothetical protein
MNDDGTDCIRCGTLTFMADGLCPDCANLDYKYAGPDLEDIDDARREEEAIAASHKD